jgi:hypothetical protein
MKVVPVKALNLIGWFVLSGAVGTAVGGLPRTLANEPGRSGAVEVREPSWKDQILGRVWYSYRKDQRRNHIKKGIETGISDYDVYKINQEGIVRGSDLLEIVRPADQALFEQILARRGVKGEPSTLYRTYLSELTEQGMALLVLARILDHEAMKRKMPPAVSDERVDYVLRAVLTQNAVSRGALKLRRPLMERPRHELLLTTTLRLVRIKRCIIGYARPSEQILSVLT